MPAHLLTTTSTVNLRPPTDLFPQWTRQDRRPKRRCHTCSGFTSDSRHQETPSSAGATTHRFSPLRGGRRAMDVFTGIQAFSVGTPSVPPLTTASISRSCSGVASNSRKASYRSRNSLHALGGGAIAATVSTRPTCLPNGSRRTRRRPATRRIQPPPGHGGSPTPRAQARQAIRLRRHLRQSQEKSDESRCNAA